MNIMSFYILYIVIHIFVAYAVKVVLNIMVKNIKIYNKVEYIEEYDDREYN